MSRKLEVSIVGDSRSLSKAFGKAGRDGDSFGKRMSRGAGKGLKLLGLGVAGLAVGVGVALGGALTMGVKSLAAHEKASAQTAAVLKSTGAAAGVSQEGVESLSDAIEKMSGMDDLAVQSGANLLLTFTNIKNEAGKGNDVFNQTVGIMADMSTALGQDTKASAIQLGKALNDPIKGVTALSKVGVSFTQGQRDAIKAMVDAGDTAGAQKIILAELNKEFGGSAKAAGETLGGQVNILKARFEELTEKIATAVMPMLTRLVAWATENWPAFEAAITAAIARIVAWFQANWPTIQAIAVGVFQALSDAWNNILHPALDAIVAAFGALVTTTREHWGQIQAAAQGVINWYNNVLAPTIKSVIATLTAIWAKYGAEITAIIAAALGVVKATLTAAFNVIKGIVTAALAILRGDWGEAWNALKGVVSSAIEGAKAVLKAQVELVVAVAKGLGTAIIDGVEAGAKKLGAKVKELLGNAKDAITEFDISGAASGLGGRVLSGILGALSGLGGKIAGLVHDAVNGVLGAVESKLNKALTFDISVKIPGFDPPGPGSFGGTTLSVGHNSNISIPRFDDGGVMPGPRGEHNLALVAGGETISPTHKQGHGLGTVVHIHMPESSAHSDPNALAAALEFRLRSVSA